MRLDELAPADIAAQLKRLKGAYPGTKMSDQDFHAFSDELRTATRQWSRVELEEAVGSVIQESKYFPRISLICSHRPHRKWTPEQEATVNSACRRCHKEAFLAAYESADGRIHQRYRCACDPGQPGWHTEAAKIENHRIENGTTKALAA